MISRPKIKKSDISMLLWSAPFVILIFAFSYVPLFGWVYSLFDYKVGVPLLQNHFVGLQNFKEIFSTTGEIFEVLRNTLVMNFLNILMSPLPIIFAIMLNEIKNPFFKRLAQTITTLPNFISWIIVYSLAFSIFSSEGLLTQLFEKLNSSITVNVLSNVDATWYFQTILTIWKTMGWTAIIYIAAIAGIDNELYDAAKVDGAGFFSQVIHVTIPGIIPTFIVLLLLSMANMLSSNFDQYFVFYNSVVAEKIQVIDYFSYKIGILANNYSLGTAVSALKSVISISLLFFFNFVSKRVRGESII